MLNEVMNVSFYVDARDRHSVELHSVNIQPAMQADYDIDNSSIQVMMGVYNILKIIMALLCHNYSLAFSH